MWFILLELFRILAVCSLLSIVFTTMFLVLHEICFESLRYQFWSLVAFWLEVSSSECVFVLCRANAQQPKLFVGMILILIFAEALALYGLIVGIILSSRSGQSRAD